MILDGNILNNKRSISSFSVQILSIFTFSKFFFMELLQTTENNWNF